MKGYAYMQKEVCQTADGRHDALMQQVFERFLQQEEPAPQVASLFTTAMKQVNKE